jgi:hypothetical protein
VPALLLATACVPPAPHQPAPLNLHSARAATDALKAASARLVTDGFDLASSDASAGVITAVKTDTPERMIGLITCRYHKGSMAATSGESSLRVAISATDASAGGSDLVIHAHVTTSMQKLPGMFKDTPDSEDDCASTGQIEAELATAAGAGAPPPAARAANCELQNTAELDGENMSVDVYAAADSGSRCVPHHCNYRGGALTMRRDAAIAKCAADAKRDGSPAGG